MKIIPAPNGIMIWDTKMKPNDDNLYLNATELEEIIRWLDERRHGFIEDVLARKK